MYQIIDMGDSRCIRRDYENNQSIFIPQDPANTNYQQYLAWVAEGNEPEVIDLSG